LHDHQREIGPLGLVLQSSSQALLSRFIEHLARHHGRARSPGDLVAQGCHAGARLGSYAGLRRRFDEYLAVAAGGRKDEHPKRSASWHASLLTPVAALASRPRIATDPR